MKLFRYKRSGATSPGIMIEGRHFDVSDSGFDYDPDFFSAGGSALLKEWFQKNRSSCREITGSIHFDSCITRPGKIVCIGLNFRDHALETGAKIPAEPVIFMKAPSALCGVSDDLVLPRNSEKTDWEVEFSFVIGTKGAYVAADSALDHVAGFALFNDYSERHFQKERGGQWTKGKSCDTFAPIGPYLVTAEELRYPRPLSMWLKVNGETMQSSSTAEMIFDVPYLISYITQFMSLLPGDIVTTGTPAGVGLARDRFLRDGDKVEYGIEGLGEASQVVRSTER
ncbi:MAG: fumarylacetoacetate hydrolase family protein [Deltaproteobacteria bacterium]|nr:fumarylacetoacetate hydrolase family protein [Deltaproteobacteria bacterium]